LVAIDESLARLAEHDDSPANLVKLKYFAGLSVDEIAGVMQISPRQVHRLWVYARSWLHQDIHGTPPEP
jgi:DNA-directed RNA polymerase specialized sigma24 family protein